MLLHVVEILGGRVLGCGFCLFLFCLNLNLNSGGKIFQRVSVLGTSGTQTLVKWGTAGSTLLISI